MPLSPLVPGRVGALSSPGKCHISQGERQETKDEVVLGKEGRRTPVAIKCPSSSGGG